MIRVIALGVSLASPGPLLAQDYCRPGPNGADRIQKIDGRACPSGYFASGNCYEAFRRDQPQAFRKIEGRSCPSGTFASGSGCVPFR